MRRLIRNAFPTEEMPSIHLNNDPEMNESLQEQDESAVETETVNPTSSGSDPLKNLESLINKLIQAEFSSAFLYLAMANYFNRLNYIGMGKWLQCQYDEERGHAQKLIDYLTDLNRVVEVKEIPAQPTDFGKPLQVWQKVLEHEQMITSTYQDAYDEAMKVKDYRTAGLFQEFLQEQIDEEAQVFDIIGRLEINSDNSAGLLILDQEIGQRAE